MSYKIPYTEAIEVAAKTIIKMNPSIREKLALSLIQVMSEEYGLSEHSVESDLTDKLTMELEDMKETLKKLTELSTGG